jgi:hypothetical protein
MNNCSYGISIVLDFTGFSSVIVSVGVPYLCMLHRMCWLCISRLWLVVFYVSDVFVASDCEVSTSLSCVCLVASPTC